MESSEFHHALALLEWQVELGATEAICDAPVNCYELPERLTAPKPAAPAQPPAAPAVATPVDPVVEAEELAAAAADLDELQTALAGFEHCGLKRGARTLVFSDGIPGAPVMIVGEAPGRDEDREGRPFVGRAGQLLDRMLAAIDMGRADQAAPVYITNVLPWRPPQNRDPQPEEIAMMRPFLQRHIALAQPKVLVIMGNISAQALLGKRGITRLRGIWTDACGLPALPMFHPAYLLRQPAAKREAWADLLSLKARLSDG
ncbi:uracil-DNA glycosylase [Roseobacter sinensis]|uniref:Type-4 uracil-DNA glycosylase n=1 Tax=Roseobacter sinensis TaxID=2931391 RepID=A0ABT3BB79_9RHOB|nr:uracil-DNA glycosylase [Roseobacter sp. WL0113]MCV3270669.1 uracil-DNA glycosylase [Roseobacter sp. WL0113]